MLLRPFSNNNQRELLTNNYAILVVFENIAIVRSKS